MIITCSECNGTGIRRIDVNEAKTIFYQEKCDKCGGTGRVDIPMVTSTEFAPNLRTGE